MYCMQKGKMSGAGYKFNLDEKEIGKKKYDKSFI